MKPLPKSELKVFHIIGNPLKWQMLCMAYSEFHACYWYRANYGWEIETITIEQ